MSTIYDALQRAERSRLEQPVLDEGDDYKPSPSKSHVRSMMREALYPAFQALAADRPHGGMVLTFAGPCAHEGVSTLTREFAKLASMELGLKVLLLDADHGQGHHGESLGVSLSKDWEAVSAGQEELSDVLVTVVQDKLELGAVCLNGSFTANIAARPRFSELFKNIREEFDLTLIDVPAVSDSPEALAFAKVSDGVVLVVAAESTRWQVAKQAKDSIEKAGGKVIGAILNKKRYHIPEFIYRRL